MRSLHKRGLIALLLMTGGLFHSPANAQNIVLNEGSGDIFFLYNSSADVWNTVFRVKGTTVASGLTTPFNTTSDPALWTGILGNEIPTAPGATGDHLYDSLTVNLQTTATIDVDGTDFFYTHTSGQFQNPDAGVPDLGIRIRLREDQVVMGIGSNAASNQFENFTFTLNTALSTFNGTPLQDTSAHVSLFGNDGFGNPEVLFNSAGVNQLEGTFNNIWTHQHRNWGFSEYGQYAVVLDVQGVGGEYGNSNHQATINFDVIPEPGTMALLLVGLGFGGWLRSRRLARS